MSDKWADALRSNARSNMLAALRSPLGRAAYWREVVYDRDLRAYVYPVYGLEELSPDGNWWLSACVEVLIYDTRWSSWYVSKIPETLAAYHSKRLRKRDEYVQYAADQADIQRAAAKARGDAARLAAVEQASDIPY